MSHLSRGCGGHLVWWNRSGRITHAPSIWALCQPTRVHSQLVLTCGDAASRELASNPPPRDDPYSLAAVFGTCPLATQPSPRGQRPELVLCSGVAAVRAL